MLVGPGVLVGPGCPGVLVGPGVGDAVPAGTRVRVAYGGTAGLQTLYTG